MLKIENGNVTIKGSRMTVMSDLTMLINNIKENVDVPKEDFIYAVDLAFRPFKEVKKEALEKAIKMSPADIMAFLTAAALDSIMEERNAKEKKDNE